MMHTMTDINRLELFTKFIIMIEFIRRFMTEYKKYKELENKKQRLLKKDMDYAFLEHLIQDMNENPLLRIKITLKDGTVLDINTKPKKQGFDEIVVPVEEFREVR